MEKIFKPEALLNPCAHVSPVDFPSESIGTAEYPQLSTILPSGNGVLVGVSVIVGVSDASGVGETVRLGVEDAGNLVDVIAGVEPIFSPLLHPAINNVNSEEKVIRYFPIPSIDDT